MEERIAKELAKAIAATCVRNTFLESLHDGPSPLKDGTADESVVVTPKRELPWTEVSRISQEEMATLMREVVNKVYSCLVHLGEPDFLTLLEEKSRPFTDQWDEPVADRSIEAMSDNPQLIDYRAPVSPTDFIGLADPSLVLAGEEGEEEYVLRAAGLISILGDSGLVMSALKATKLGTKTGSAAISPDDYPWIEMTVSRMRDEGHEIGIKQMLADLRNLRAGSPGET